MALMKTCPLMVLGLIAGCAATETDDAINLPALSFAELNQLEAALDREIILAGDTRIEDIPTMGTATYDGTLALLLQDGSADGVIGAVSLRSDFATDVITGEAGNFFDLDGNPTSGSLRFEDTVRVEALGNFIGGEANGQVTFGTGPMIVETGLAGNFSGDNAEYISGVLAGSATPLGGSEIPVQGGFYAAQ